MPRNASGVYAPDASTWNPAVNNTIISPTDWNALLVDLTAALNSIPYITIAARPQRSATASPIVVATNDQIINFNINSGSPVCTLPLSTGRAGKPLTFQDAGGHATAHPLTFSTTGGETMSGIASGSVALNTNFSGITFTPYNDGVNTGWVIG